MDAGRIKWFHRCDTSDVERVTLGRLQDEFAKGASRDLADASVGAEYLNHTHFQQKYYIPGTEILRVLSNSTASTTGHRSITRISLLDQLITDIAPLVWLHKKDPCGPMDPKDFFNNAELKWYRIFRTQLKASRGQFTFVNYSSIDYKYRIRDGSNILLIRPSEHVHPFEGDSPKNQGYYLDYKPKPDTIESWGENPLPGPTPVMIDVTPTQFGFILTYWFFYKNSRWRLGLFGHQGDWERISIQVDAPHHDEGIELIPYVVKFYQHYDSPETLMYSECEKDGTHVIAYCAKGSHACYPKKQGHTRKTRNLDSCSDDIAWKTWNNISPLWQHPLEHFGGAWGKVSKWPLGLFRKYISGPSGPMFKPKVLPRWYNSRVQAITYDLGILDEQKNPTKITVLRGWWIPIPVKPNLNPVSYLNLEWYTEIASTREALAIINPKLFDPPQKDELVDGVCRLASGMGSVISPRYEPGHTTANWKEVRWTKKFDGAYRPKITNMIHPRQLVPFNMQMWDRNRLESAGFNPNGIFYFRTKFRRNCSPCKDITISSPISIDTFPTKYTRQNHDQFISTQYRYLANDAKGTIHDLLTSDEKHLQQICSSKNMILLPVKAGSEYYAIKKFKKKTHKRIENMLMGFTHSKSTIRTHYVIDPESVVLQTIYKKDSYESVYPRTKIPEYKRWKFCPTCIKTSN